MSSPNRDAGGGDRVNVAAGAVIGAVMAPLVYLLATLLLHRASSDSSGHRWS